VNAQNIAALVTAITGLVAAVGAIWHSTNTRKALKTHHKLTTTGKTANPSGRV
jgi:hypothetical protein